MDKKFKNENTAKERYSNMKRLMKPFLKKYNEPVLVHSTPDNKTFTKIIKEGSLLVPKKKDASKAHIERLLGLYPSIFLSLGFIYASGYNFKFSLIFKLNLLKESKYYRRSISFQAYKKTATYWDENNPEYLERLSKKNKTCKAVVNKFYNVEYEGKTKSLFDFWKCENEIFNLIKKYPKKNRLLKMYKEIEKERFFKYPLSIKKAKEDCNQNYAPEVIVMHDINLIDNKNFLGFHIKGRISESMNRILKSKYPGKILFDGKKIQIIR